MCYFCRVKQGVFFIVVVLLFKPVFPVVDYLVNYDYFSKVLCENKAKPELQCNGKCALMKQLAKVSEAEKQGPKDKKSTTKIEWEVPFILLQWDSLITYLPSTLRFTPLHYTNLYAFTSQLGVFHPPTV